MSNRDNRMNVPIIRFQEFDGEWKTSRLSKCLTISNVKNSNNYFRKDDVLSVSDDDGVVNQIILLGRSYAGKSVSNYSVLKTNQIVYTKSPLKSKPYGIIKVNKGLTGIVSVLYAVYDAKDGVDPEYIHYYFDPAYRINKYLAPLVNKGAKNTMNISDKEVLSGQIFIPTKEEQKAIAQYFRNLDSLIQTMEKKIASLRQVKEASLQAMFPAEGETVPKVRFKGFEEEWELARLSNLYEKVCEKNDLSYGADKIISVANMYFQNTDSKQTSFSDEEYMRSYNIMKLGDIAFEGNKSKNFSYGRFVENTIGDGIVSHVFTVLRPINQYDIFFWKYYINNENTMRNVLRKCTKASTMMNDLVINDFLKETIRIPSLKEQQRIGAYFNALDKQITIQTQHLEKLKQIKSACLDAMFV